jgi:hypothetical protein
MVADVALDNSHQTAGSVSEAAFSHCRVVAMISGHQTLSCDSSVRFSSGGSCLEPVAAANPVWVTPAMGAERAG